MKSMIRMIVQFVLCLAVLAPGIAQAQESFYLQDEENSTMGTIVQASCSNPSQYAGIKQRAAAAASSADAMATGLVYAQRNKFHVIKTDLAIYEAYYPSACTRTRIAACSVGRAMSAEQACDCAAGYPGDVQYGIGAGELLASANQEVGRQACAVAAQRATGMLRARYLAQLGRAQLYQRQGTYQGSQTLRQAIASGYRRAEIDIARAYLRDLEFGGETRIAWFNEAMNHLAIARRSGAIEASIIVESFAQLAAVRQLNVAVFDLWRRLN